MILMVTGLKQSGKDTSVKYITKNYGFSRYAFADKIKEVVSILYGWSLDYIENHKEKIDSFYGISPRQALQDIGTDYMQFHMCEKFPMYSKAIGRNFWAKKFQHLYLQNTNINYAISDYRFLHEYELLKEYFPITIRINNNKCYCDGHESENNIANLHADYEVDNNGTHEELYKQLDYVMSMCTQGRKEI